MHSNPVRTLIRPAALVALAMAFASCATVTKDTGERGTATADTVGGLPLKGELATTTPQRSTESPAADDALTAVTNQPISIPIPSNGAPMMFPTASPTASRGSSTRPISAWCASTTRVR